MFKGADRTNNEEQFNKPPATGSGVLYNETRDPIDRRHFGGLGRREYQNPDGTYHTGESGADREVNRYRQMGAASMGRPGVHVDFSRALDDRQRALEARRRQMGALDMLEGAARGTAPSRAEIMGRGMIDDSIDASMSVAASSRGGPLASADAMQRAQFAGGATRAKGLRDLTALRADEMRAARTDLMGGASALRAGDYAGSDQGIRMGMAQAEQDARQRMLDQQDRQFFEQQAFAVNDAELHAGLATAGMDASSYEAGQARRQAQNNADRQFYGSVIGGGASTLGDYAKYSDPLGKTNIQPLRSAPMGGEPWMPPGSLPSRTMPTSRNAPMGADPADVDFIRGGGFDPNDVDAIRYGEAAPQELLEDRYNAVGRATAPWLEGYQAPIIRENPYGEPPPGRLAQMGDISRDDPYKTSDERAKEAAFMDGRRYQEQVASSEARMLKEGGPKFAAEVEAAKKRVAEKPNRFTPIGAPPGEQAAPPAQMMDSIGPGKSFQYKPGVPGEDPNKPQFGTTTQDLRKTQMGASMVTVDPQTGLEQIDVREAVGPILASLGNLNLRVRKQEKGGR